ncbi:MAG: hypothetical protein CMC94_05925 [Flavobacteriales bacterium]|jgi:hypothetical protein|nr:hypothetical protein [Flavobacteriales bacterium]MDG1146469.1 hypothetical protein [Flavobacteriales bacterium]MDG1396168.1 hypothetical protein [Flavobacteriales bacterium]|tara:strand:- start:1818 stop:2018 length:201 start_codon:yes stop_codon:yes gene_type:complete
MYGDLIHTEHRIETVSEYYFDAALKLVTEMKNLTDNRTKLYTYSLKQFETTYKDSRVNKCFSKIGL